VEGRWPNGAICTLCGKADAIFLANQRGWQCEARHPQRQFSVKVGTILEDSPLGLDKWLVAMWLIVNCKNGVSCYEVHQALGITQKTAWFMDRRVRLALRAGEFENLGGEVEADETFVGGKARNMDITQRKRRITGTGTKDNVAVMGILERGREVPTVVVESRKKKIVRAEVKKHVEAGAPHSDELKSYVRLESDYTHKVINPTVE
jgi:ISXO2 transposase-like protein